MSLHHPPHYDDSAPLAGPRTLLKTLLLSFVPPPFAIYSFSPFVFRWILFTFGRWKSADTLSTLWLFGSNEVVVRAVLYWSSFFLHLTRSRFVYVAMVVYKGGAPASKVQRHFNQLMLGGSTPWDQVRFLIYYI